MSKIAVVYWSGTGNTKEMAVKLAEGATNAGAQVDVLTCDKFDSSMVASYDAIAFGCPAMGGEELEEEEFLPMFESCESQLHDKRIALFGSYGWGVGEWMENWKAVCVGDGAELVADPVIANGAPNEDDVNSLLSLGAALV